MGKKIKLEQAKAQKLEIGKPYRVVYDGKRTQGTRHGDRTLHAFHDAKTGECFEVWGTSVIDRSPDLARAVGKEIVITRMTAGGMGEAASYELEIV